jgi:hypothetical protein
VSRHKAPVSAAGPDATHEGAVPSSPAAHAVGACLIALWAAVLVAAEVRDTGQIPPCRESCVAAEPLPASCRPHSLELQVDEKASVSGRLACQAVSPAFESAAETCWSW